VSCDAKGTNHESESMHPDVLIMQGIVSTKQFESHLTTVIHRNLIFIIPIAYCLLHTQEIPQCTKTLGTVRTINKLDLIISLPLHPTNFSFLDCSYWSLNFECTEPIGVNTKIRRYLLPFCLGN
jgi:hypothetical protein